MTTTSPTGSDPAPAALEGALVSADPAPRHPAPYSPAILTKLAELAAQHLDHDALVLDPFAGTGRVHSLRLRSVGVEIEPEWARMHGQTIVGDATALPFPDATFDGAITSPCYGNRMADHHNARDASHRNTYRHLLGRPLTDGSAGAMQWGDAYRDLHVQAWHEVHRVLKPAAIFMLNTKDFVRRGAPVAVTEWHHATLCTIGFTRVEQHEVHTPGNRFGQNHRARVDHEVVAVFRRVG